MSDTINEYNRNFKRYIEQYESANLDGLHSFILENSKDVKTILDVGFGSGREILFLKQNGFDVWGVDATENFVSYVQEKLKESKKFQISYLPDLVLPNNFPKKFDMTISIAVLMHLPKELHKKAIKRICEVTKNKVVISYSTKKREDKRFYEEINSKDIEGYFNKNEFNKIATLDDKDSLNRDIEWVTEVYKSAKSN